MDRQIVYPAQIPLDSDLLNAQRNAFVGLGHLAGMAYGDNTVAAGGFACTPGTGLAVTIAPGSLLAAGVVDISAYGTLAANGSVLVRQYVSRDPVTLTVPGAGATYTVYATPTTVDADATVLPFYNAADPSVTYAGADNSGKAAPTVRQDLAQLGIAATVPDGAYPLWTITVPAAATAITSDMIAQAEGAPFYETIPELQADLAGRLKLNDTQSQTVTGPVTFAGETEVPDTEDFTSKEALNAETAEGRYVGSVLAAGSTNIRITDVQEDASGNLIATMSDGTTQTYAPTSWGVLAASGDFLGGVWTKTGGVLRQTYRALVGGGTDSNVQVNYPIAFSEAPGVVVTTSQELAGGHYFGATSYHNGTAGDYTDMVTATGFALQFISVNGSSINVSTSQFLISVTAEGQA
ncbi:hypothetical protein ACU81Q_16325 [Komagataeibacter melomenusus]